MFIITRDDVVSQRLKFGSAFLWFSWESKLPCFFKLSRIPSPSRKNGVILFAATSNHSASPVMCDIMRNSITVGGHVRFQKNFHVNSQFENLNDAHNIDAYVCNLLS